MKNYDEVIDTMAIRAIPLTLLNIMIGIITITIICGPANIGLVLFGIICAVAFGFAWIESVVFTLIEDCKIDDDEAE